MEKINITRERVKTIVIIVLISVLMVYIGYLYIIGLQQEAYLQGFTKGEVDTVNTILRYIESQGYISFNIENKTIVLIQYTGEL